MKKYLIILILLFTCLAAYTQEEGDDKGGKIRDRMNEYIQDRLGLSKREAEKISPVFLRYFHEFRQIRVEPRANKVFVYEDEFRRKAIQMLETRRDRLGEKTLQRNRSLLQ